MELEHLGLNDEIQKATREVFTMMLGTELEGGVGQTERNGCNTPVGVISFIGIAGQWAGTGSLVASPKTACRMASLFLMDEFTVVTEEVLDAFAELTNMIMGSIKTQLEDKLGPMALSVPTALFGRNFVTRTVGISNWTVVSFSLEGERLDVQISLARQNSANHPTTGQVYAGVLRAG